MHAEMFNFGLKFNPTNDGPNDGNERNDDRRLMDGPIPVYP